MSKEFFKKQEPITALKTKVYEEYITGYLPKLLIQFGQCMMFDLFCGPGKNGEEKGSPLILMDQLKYILSSPHIQQREGLRVDVFFNDQEKSFIDNLEKELSALNYDRSTVHVKLTHQCCKGVLPGLVDRYGAMKEPKFFFLDPFKYSDVRMGDLSSLMALQYTEVLLFVPLFHTYRFVSASAEFSEGHKTRAFIEEFTSRGISDYTDTLDYLLSIKERLESELARHGEKPYVREILLDAGTKKNALFLITRHQAGMLLMNKTVLRLTDGGSVIKVKDAEQMDLFSSAAITDTYKLLSKNVEQLVKERGQIGISNRELVDFVIRQGYLPKHGREIVKVLVDAGRAVVLSENREPLTNSRDWNLAEKTTKTTVIMWGQKNEAE